MNLINKITNSSIVSETQRVASETKQKSGLRSHERGNKTDLSMVASLHSQILRIDEASGKSPRFIATRRI